MCVCVCVCCVREFVYRVVCERVYMQACCMYARTLCECSLCALALRVIYLFLLFYFFIFLLCVFFFWMSAEREKGARSDCNLCLGVLVHVYVHCGP